MSEHRVGSSTRGLETDNVVSLSLTRDRDHRRIPEPTPSHNDVDECGCVRTDDGECGCIRPDIELLNTTG
jgi:hypothetical protein